MIILKQIMAISVCVLVAQAAPSIKDELLKAIPAPPASIEAEAVLGAAIMSATVAEIEKRKHEPGTTTAFRFVGGLQTVLFNDDFNFAAHFDPSLNPNDLGQTRESVLKALSEKSIEELEQSLENTGYTKRRAGLSLPERNDSLKNVYGRFASNSRFGHAQAHKAMVPLKGNLLRTDFFKDACIYIGFDQRMDLWLKEGLEHNQKLVNDSLNRNQGLEQQLRDLENLADLNDGTIRTFEPLRESARAIFAYRFEHIHGLDPDRTLEALSKITLHPDAAPIRIPAP